jgi:5-methyltetrahydrofolate--homocysteine methyltransferase
VVSSLLSADKHDDFVSTVQAEFVRLREAQEARQGDRTILSLDEARRRKPVLGYDDVSRPTFLGVRTYDDFPLDRIEPFIDWNPFFSTWELRGRYPEILEEPRARELYDDARKLLREIVEKRLLHARAVHGFWPANSVGDDVELYADDSRSRAIARFHALRQQQETASKLNLALADFVAPKESGIADYIGGFAVTAGIGVEELVARFQRDHDDYNSIMTKALADRLAEALAELLHRESRRAWYAPDESIAIGELIAEKYRGIRPAAGYPACPDHTEKRTLFNLLGAEEHGIRLTESFAMLPAASVSGLYFAHPDSRYFAVGRIGKDQVFDYHIRKDMPLPMVERWLSPNLAYDPESSPTDACSCGAVHA